MMGLIDRDDGWRMPDWLWAKIEPLLPPPPFHPLGTHRSRIPNRRVMDAILLVLRTGMQWNGLRITDICNSSTAQHGFQEWERAGVFHEIWRHGLLDYDQAIGIDWSFLAADIGRACQKKKPPKPLLILYQEIADIGQSLSRQPNNRRPPPFPGGWALLYRSADH